MISYFPYFSSKMEAIKREGKLCENENTDVIFCGKDLKLQLSCVMAGRGIGAGDINMARRV